MPRNKVLNDDTVEIPAIEEEVAASSDLSPEHWTFLFWRNNARIACDTVRRDGKIVPVQDVPDYVFAALQQKVYRWHNLIFPQVTTGEIGRVKALLTELDWQDRENLSWQGSLMIER